MHPNSLHNELLCLEGKLSMRSIGWLFAMVFTVLSVSSALGADKIKLALNWVPEPEFGGIYAAQQQHFFANNGLDVEIQPGGAGTPTWQLVATGKVDYAVA